MITGQFQYNYTLNGQYDLLTFPNGQTRDYNYDDQGRLTQIANAHPTPGNLATYAYSYDVDHSTGQNTMLGQRSGLTATVPSQNFSSHQTKYYYDNTYQLRKADYPNVAPLNGEVHQWTYDAIGNRLTNTINSTTQNYTYYKNGSNQLNGQQLQSDSTKTYTYDFNGNTASDGTYTYTWDREDRLTGISGGGLTVTYKYKYSGSRTSKTVNGQTTTYIYDGQNLIAERGASVAEFLHGPGIDEPLAMYRSTTAYYYDVDGLGSVNLVNDSGGTVQDKYLYDGWGITRSSTTPIANPFVYTARETGEAGLLFYRARYYNPNIGRFASEDPIRFASWYNFYAYVGNSPIGRSDPSGLNWRDWTITTPAAIIFWSWCVDCALSQYIEGNARFPAHRIQNHQRHCWTSCQVTKRCSPLCYFLMSNANEANNPEIADFVSNAKGFGIARDGGDCDRDCQKCDPSVPPGDPPPAGPPPKIPTCAWFTSKKLCM